MRYGSVCSGIEAATVAWHPLGWEPQFFSEIEAFPSEVLSDRYPHVPNLGDMTRFKEWPDAAIDVLVGGTPCQSFSVAGLRKGLADPRGNLALTYLGIADRYRPSWVVWENVPGVLSSAGGRDFGSFLGGLGELGYGWAYRVLDAQFVRVDGFGRAVPQRRRRVFVVGYLGDWRRAAAVLFERESLLGNPAPRREARQGAAAGTREGAAFGGGNRSGSIDAAACLTAKGQRIDFEVETFIAEPFAPAITSNPYGDHESREGLLVAFDTTQITSKANRSVPKDGDPCHPLAAGAHAPAIAFNSREDPEVTFDRSGPLGASSPQAQAVAQGWAVRRLTPLECERLQGFPDGYTAIDRKGKPAADGPRYKALGNSMAVNVMRWIGRRIEMVDALSSELSREEAA